MAKTGIRDQVAKVKDAYDTNEKKIAELRKQRDPKLGVIFVTRMDFVDALLEEYTVVGVQLDGAKHVIEQLKLDLEIANDKLRMEVATNNELDRREHERNLDVPSVDPTDAPAVQDTVG